MLKNIINAWNRKKVISDLGYMTEPYLIQNDTSYKKIESNMDLLRSLSQEEIEKIKKLKNKNGENFLHIICKQEKTKIADIHFFYNLLGEDFFYQLDNRGWTPLKWALIQRKNFLKEIEENSIHFNFTAKNLLMDLISSANIDWLEDKHVLFLVAATYKKEELLNYIFDSNPELYDINTIMSKSSHCFASLMLSLDSGDLLNKIVKERKINLYNVEDHEAVDTLLLNLIVIEDNDKFNKQVEILLDLKEEGLYQLFNNKNNCEALANLKQPERMEKLTQLGIDFSALNSNYLYCVHLALKENIDVLRYQTQHYSTHPEQDSYHVLKYVLLSKKDTCFIDKMLNFYFDEMNIDINSVELVNGTNICMVIGEKGQYLDESIISSLDYLGADLFSQNEHGIAPYDLFAEHLKEEISAIFVEPVVLKEREILNKKIQLSENKKLNLTKTSTQRL